MEMLKQTINGRMCPFIKDPDSDCYCTKLDSRYTEAMILFCSGAYERCSIYKRKSASSKLSEDTTQNPI
ncbi:MAG: hypothetical protein HY096_07020 [Nitrospinae bacterium]|nr:hypothetical protein [Nitrospinota bacterium]